MIQYVLLSHILKHDTPAYGNRDKVIIRVNTSIEAGDSANSSCLILSNNHIGTHLDVPRHCSIDGKRTIDYEIADFIFDDIVLVDIPIDTACLLKPSHFDNLLIRDNVELLLIRTGFESKRGTDDYWNNNPGLSPDLASYFRRKFPRLRCVGLDFISVTSWKFRTEGRQAHKAFLVPGDESREIWAIEDMSLANAPLLINRIIVSPLLVEDGNGASVTVIAEY